MARPPRCANTCGWCPMLGGTLPYLWIVPYAGRNPPENGKGSPQPPRVGGVAPLAERFEATLPLRALGHASFGLN